VKVRFFGGLRRLADAAIVPIMPRKPSENTIPTTIKLSSVVLDKADELAQLFGDDGPLPRSLTRTEILRFAVIFGLKDIEAQARAYKKRRRRKKV
jgi:hypothetical protein